MKKAKTTVGFRKYHGFGNDYFVFLASELSEVGDLAKFAVEICDRNKGAGSDGLAILKESSDGLSDYSCRIINPDGSEAGFSGNGTRCAVAHLYREKLWDAPTLRLSTRSGVKNYEFLSRTFDLFRFKAELGKPVFDTEKVPFVRTAGSNKVVDFKGDALVEIDTAKRSLYVPLNVGNPVCAVFVDDFAPNWRTIGAAIEKHPCFPDRANVVFVRPENESRIDIRIWERGAGETSSSGTCSIAAAVASAYLEKTLRRVLVRAPGGITEAEWREDGEMLITGTAEYVYSGEWEVG
ncbi:MAG: diaminopimelate epimerase [Pyrinomonadaceae bacterium]